MRKAACHTDAARAARPPSLRLPPTVTRTKRLPLPHPNHSPQVGVGAQPWFLTPQGSTLPPRLPKQRPQPFRSPPCPQAVRAGAGSAAATVTLALGGRDHCKTTARAGHTPQAHPTGRVQGGATATAALAPSGTPGVKAGPESREERRGFRCCYCSVRGSWQGGEAAGPNSLADLR